MAPFKIAKNKNASNKMKPLMPDGARSLYYFFQHSNRLNFVGAVKRKKLTVSVVSAFIIASLVSGFLLLEIMGNRLYTYNLSVAEKSFSITIRTDWNSAPKLCLSDSSLASLKFISVDFIGSCRKTITFKIAFPTDLLSGNISLVWKYYELSPNRYVLSTNGTHTFVLMTFTHIAIDEHFEIHGTEGAW